jgi:hypothetical protein
VQTLNRRMRQIISETPPEDGLVVGPLTIAAEHLVAQLQTTHGLSGEEHEAAILAYLVGCWGELAHAFPEQPEIPGYLAWRSRCAEQAAGGRD